MTITDVPIEASGDSDEVAPDAVQPARSRLGWTASRWELWGEKARDAVAAIRKTAVPILKTVRPVGWVCIGGAVLAAVLGVRLGWWELTTTAVILAVVVVLCALFLFGRSTYDVALDLTRTRVIVGERAYGAMTLRNTGRRTMLPSRVVLPVGKGRGVFPVPRLGPGEEQEEVFTIPTAARGVLPVGPVSVLRGDPLGLFERVHDRRDVVDLYVHPRTVSLGGLSLGFMKDLEGLPATDLSRDDVSFHALRDYQPGDDRRHVHWRSTARTGQLMVRQYEETRRSHFVVGLSTHPGDYATDDEFELAISVAGSVGLRALRDSRTLEVRVPGRTLPSSSGKRFLDSLSALTHSRPREGGIITVAGAVGAQLSHASVAVLVCGSTVSAADLRIACSRIPSGVRCLAVVAEHDASPSLKRVAEADVITLGSLDRLAPALRKVLS